MSNHILDNISSPSDVKSLNKAELSQLCGEIRQFLIDNVSKTGGHLAANLGIVEIGVAIHRVFNAPLDKVIYDVGHQCYVHKIITGRRDKMGGIRSLDGISGFLRPSESQYDTVISGHASTSISSGIGMLRGERLQGRDSHVVCVIGDGAMTGGMAYEALNDAGQSKNPLIVIYNDNGMSIGQNVGALTRKMSGIRVKPRYFKTKKTFKTIATYLPAGDKIVDILRNMKNFAKKTVLKESIFEILGFDYLGPCDGNDINMVLNMLLEAKSKNKPVLLHFKTQKGKGYVPSETHPESYHGVSPFDVETGTAIKKSNDTFSTVFGRHLTLMAGEDPRICGITAAMAEGTGLDQLAEKYPKRFFDVGIAEEHGVTMTAALAKTGMVPFFAVYATFLQRGFDQLIHDNAIEGVHSIFCVDRGGITGEDGETHHGVFDVPELSIIPGITILSPSSYSELRSAMKQAAGASGTVAIRYPRGAQGAYTEDNFSSDALVLKGGEHITIVSYGIMINQAIKAAEELERIGIKAEVVKLNSLTADFTDIVKKSVQKTGRLIVLEECVSRGSVGEGLLASLTQGGVHLKYARLMNVGNSFVTHGKVQELYVRCGIDSGSVVHAAEQGVKL